MGREWEKDEKRERGERQRVTERVKHSLLFHSIKINRYPPQIFIHALNETFLDIVNAPIGYTVALISWYIIIIQCFVSLTRVLWTMMIHEDWYWTENKLTFGATNEKALQHSNIYILIYAFFLDIYFMEWTCTFKLWSNAMIKKEDKCKLHYVFLCRINPCELFVACLFAV